MVRRESLARISHQECKGRGPCDGRDAHQQIPRGKAHGLVERSVRQRSCRLTVWWVAGGTPASHRTGRIAAGGKAAQHGTPEPNIALFNAARPHAAGQLDLVSAGRGRRGVAHSLTTAPLWMKGIGTMDKAWTTPPTAVPRAEVDCDAKSSQGRNAPTRVRIHRPIQRASLPGRLQANIAPFMHRGRGCPAQVLRRLDPVGRAGLPALVEMGDVLFGGHLGSSVAASAEILLTYTVVSRSLFPDCRTTKVTPRARETSSPNQEASGRSRQTRRRRQPRQTSLEFRPTGRGGARPGAGRPRIRRSRVAHRSSRCHSGALPRADHAARPRRRAAAAPRCASCAPSGRRCASARRVPGSG